MTKIPRLGFASLALVALVVAGVGLPATMAHAAAVGPGYDFHGDPHSHIGGYRDPDGTISYCIDAGKSSPAGGVSTDEGVTNRIHELSDATMLQLAYVLAKYGNTSDDDTASAVALVVWNLADAADHAARGGDGFVITRAPAAHRANILALADAYRAEAAAYRPPALGVASLTLAVDGAHPKHGKVEVTLSPADARGTLTLTNAVFADTGLSTREDVADGAQLEVAATAPADADEYLVEVAGEFVGTGHPDGSVHVYSTPGAQTLAASGRWLPMTFQATAHATVTVPVKLPRVAG